MYAPLTEKQAKQREEALQRSLKKMSIKDRNVMIDAVTEVEGTQRAFVGQEEDAQEDDQAGAPRSDIELVKTKIRAIGSKNKMY